MKKPILLLLGLFATLFGCNRNQDTLIGTWTVDKVTVQFDERQSTPELVRQIGEMEKGNVVSIGSDSTLVFKGLDTEWQGRISLNNDGTLMCNGTSFGTWKDGQIVTQTDSPLGEVVVVYRKK